MKDKTDMITMLTDSGESVDFYVLEETRINAVNYLLVTDAPEDQDGECYILKDVSGQQDAEAVYEFVEDDRELDGLMGVFEELLSDADVGLRNRDWRNQFEFRRKREYAGDGRADSGTGADSSIRTDRSAGACFGIRTDRSAGTCIGTDRGIRTGSGTDSCHGTDSRGRPGGAAGTAG